MPSVKSILRATAVAVLVAGGAVADDWLNLATISMTDAVTPKLANRYVCYTDGRDIRCDSPSLYVTTGGLVGINTNNPNAQLDVYGTVSATNFVGDGSGLTGVVASTGDRIVSGTNGATRMVAISSTGYISITQAGANSGWFDPTRGLVTLGVSATGPISGTAGYFSGPVGIGKAIPGGSLDVSGTGGRFYGFNPVGGVGTEVGYVPGNPAYGYVWGYDREATGWQPLVLSGSKVMLVAGGTGNVGVGMAVADSPTATLQVSGTISASDAIQVGQSSLACAAPISGSIRWNTTSGTIQVCNGTGWISLSSGTSAGVSALANLTDVNLTNIAGRDYLRYDAGSSKWVNISESTVMSTTTMVPGWPDAIRCNVTNPAIGYRVLYIQEAPYTDGKVIYREPSSQSSTNDRGVVFNSNGSYNFADFYTAHNCNTSISALYAAGQAFNFIGSANVTGTTALGDRITSGTLAMTANSATSYVSLSTNGTTWGYLNSGGSYLPTLSSNNISSSGVVQVSGSSLTCNSGLKGAIRYSNTSNTLEYCNSTVWVSAGPSSTSPVTFSAVSTVGQSVPSTAWTKLTLGGVNFDTNSNFASSRFTVSVPGKYILTAQAAIDFAAYGTGAEVWLVLYKNGSLYSSGNRSSVGVYASVYPNVTTIADAGVGDYFEVYIYVFTQNGAAQSVIAGRTAFSGALLAPQGSGSGSGGATPAGSSNDVQFNSGGALAADTGNFTYASGVLKAPTISATTQVQAPSISLTTASTTWGYLQSGGSYLPALSSNLVSGSNISATYVQIQSATTVLACNSGLAGAMRYTSGIMQVCDGSNWGNIGIGIPTGTIAAFAASSCPNGWSEYTSARGRFLRGIDNGAGNDPDGTRASGSTQADAFQGHNIGPSNGWASFWASGGSGSGRWPNGTGWGGNPDTSPLPGIPVSDGSNGTPRTANETRPKNVAVTFCRYDGYQSQLSTGVATLASLSDVSVAGTTNGQVLTYSGGTWIASTTSGGTGTLVGGGSATAIAFWNGTNSLTYESATTGGLFWDHVNGRLGINSNAPIAAVTVSSTNTSNTLLLVANSGLGGPSPRLGFVDTVSGSATTAPVWYIDNAADTFRVFRQPSYLTAGTAYLTMVSGSGNVGIGNTSPKAKLDVVGTISASDAVQVGGSSLTCSNGLAGAMRYTSGTMQVCDGTSWGNIGIGIPTGTIAAFAASSCPNGWSEYTSARGRFLRGIDNGAGNDPDGTRAAGATQADDLKSHTHSFGIRLGTSGGQYGMLDGNNTGSSGIPVTAATGGAETRPKNVAVTFCRYDGYQSQLQTGVATLASLSDVSVGGATNGQVLTYSGGAWIASTTSAGSGALGDRITSGTLAVTANTSSGYISLSTGGTTWGYLQSGGSYLPTLSSNNISSSGVVQVSGSSLSCGAGIKGAIRYSNTSSTIEYCQGTAWVSMGPSATDVPAFSVNKNGTSQGVAANSYTLLTWSNEVFDTQNNFSSNRFTPSVAGKYQVNAGAYCATAVSGYCIIIIYKNGAEVAQGRSNSTADSGANVSAVIDMNGTTDYLEAYVYSKSTTISGGNSFTYFNGTLVASGNGLVGGGGATPAGSSSDVQYNSAGALAADTGNFTYASGLLKAPTISASTQVQAPSVSLTTAGTTWGYLNSGGSYLPNISSNYVSASGVSVSGVVQVSGSSLTCGANLKGAIRYSNTSSTIEYCQGTAWVSMGPSATDVPAFLVNRNGTAQTVTANAVTVFDATHKVFDTVGNFNLTNDRFTPLVAGTYLIMANGYCSTANSLCSISVRKNGAAVMTKWLNSAGTSTDQAPGGSVLVYLNGSTDYVDMTVQNGAGTSILGYSDATFFAGTLIASGNGVAGGGGATPAGSTGDIQFNNAGALAADTGQLYWDAANNRLGINTSSPGYDLDVSGTIRANTVIQTSDKRLKKNILPYGEGLAVVEKLNPVSFNWKAGGRAAKGFIAQEVEGVLPTAVFTDGDGMKGVDFNQLMPVVVNALKELKASNDNLSAEVSTLKAANDNARTDNAALLRRVEALERKAGGAR